MKIAVCGTNYENNKKLIKDFINTYQHYISPSNTIYDEIKTDDIPSTVVEVCAQLSKKEKEFYLKMTLLSEQLKKYKDKKNIIFNGSPLDVLANCVAFCENDNPDDPEVSDEFIEKMIYWNKKLLRDLDILLWYPDSDIWNILEDEKYENSDISDILNDAEPEKTEKIIGEVARNGLYKDYLENFEKSIYYHNTDTCAFYAFETDNPMAECKNIFGKNGDMEFDEEVIDDAKMRRILNNPVLIEGYEEGIKNKSKGIEII